MVTWRRPKWLRLPAWWPRYERGTGWRLPEPLRVVLIPIAVALVLALVLGEIVFSGVWIFRRITKGK